MSTSGRVGRSPPSCPAVLSVALLSQTCVLLHCPVPQRSLSNHKAFTAIHHQLTNSVGKIARQSLGQSCGHGMCGSKGRTSGLCPPALGIWTAQTSKVWFPYQRGNQNDVQCTELGWEYTMSTAEITGMARLGYLFHPKKYSIAWKRENSLINGETALVR